jgi:pimeloyl-ACP methyl ester carboxylesterase
MFRHRPPTGVTLVDVSVVDPFRIDVAQADLDDLRERLSRTRWPDELPGNAWSRGVPVAYLKDLAGYWATGYDWRAAEAALNRYPQFRTHVDGQPIHFLHARSPEPDAVPLLLVHGWPGSVVEYVALVDPLVAAGYHVVVPSIPGFGFSAPVARPGWHATRVAGAFVELMGRLGYPRFGAAGSDWGAIISREIGRLHPDRVTGVYLTMLTAAVPRAEPGDDELAALPPGEREPVRESWQRRVRMQTEEMGYGILQSTRPQTLAYALTDSPVGQLAWIVEKFQAWTDNAGVPEDAVDRDRLLTNVMLYWLTGTANSSAGLYYETAHADGGWAGLVQPSTAPTGIGVFPRDTSLPVRHLAERTDTITHWTRFARGGHFPAMEVPDALAADLRAFFDGRR